MLNQFLIENDKLQIRINRKGAELASVTNKSGFEFIWQAGEVWPKHAPNLFPIVGSLIDHEYLYNGKSYSLSHHGFARDLEFDLLHQSEHSICLVLQHTEDTLKAYPFKFTFLVTYKLDNNSLTQTFRVINNDQVNIPVSFGGHPAFNAMPIEDFEIVLDSNENAVCHKLDGPYICDETYDVITDNKIRLTKSIFDSDALIFKELNSSTLTLKQISSDYAITVDISEFPYLGIWAKPGAPFVCIEPWQGLADHISHNKGIGEKEGILIVKDEVEKSFSMTFSN